MGYGDAKLGYAQAPLPQGGMNEGVGSMEVQVGDPLYIMPRYPVDGPQVGSGDLIGLQSVKESRQEMSS
jgi:hypothetical protein